MFIMFIRDVSLWGARVNCVSLPAGRQAFLTRPRFPKVFIIIFENFATISDVLASLYSRGIMSQVVIS